MDVDADSQRQEERHTLEAWARSVVAEAEAADRARQSGATVIPPNQLIVKLCRFGLGLDPVLMVPPMPDPLLGAPLRKLRERAGLSLRALGELAGMTAVHIGEVERGSRRFSPEAEARVRKLLDERLKEKN